MKKVGVLFICFIALVTTVAGASYAFYSWTGDTDSDVDFTIDKFDNPMTVNATQNLNVSFSPNVQTIDFTAAENAEGAVTYEIISQVNSGGTTISKFSITTTSNAKLTAAASTVAGTYTVVVRATAAGNDYYKSASKDITITIVVSKKKAKITLVDSTKALTYPTGGTNDYTYDGVATPTCTSSNTTYVTCSVDTTNHKINVTAVKPTSNAITITVSATEAAGSNYSSPDNKTFTVTVAKGTLTATATALDGIYNGSEQYAKIKVTKSDWDGATIVSGTTTNYGTNVTTNGVYNTNYNLKPGFTNAQSSTTIYYKITGGTYYNDLTGSTTAKISAKALSATEITAYSTTWVSGATTYTRNISTGIGSDTIDLTYTPSSNAVGTYEYATSAASGKFTLSQSNSNYSISSAGDLTLTGATITASVTISGTAKWGEILTANPSCTTPSSGCTFTYQWKANGTAISGATSSTYQIPKEQVGKTITVTVVAKATNYADKTITSSATSAVAKQDLTVSTVNYNAAYDGSTHYATIKVTSSEWNGATIVSGTTTDYGESVTTAGVYNTSYNLKPGYKDFTNGAKTIQYKVTGGDYYNDKTGSATVTVTKKALTATQITAYSTTWVSNASTYTRSGVATGVGSETVTLTYTPYANAVGTYSYASSASSGKFTLSQSNSNYSISSAGDLTLTGAAITASVTISGTAKWGETLTANPSCTTPSSGCTFTYQWKANGTAISGATSSTYQIPKEQVGKTITVTVVAKATNYADKTITSSATSAVAKQDLTVSTVNYNAAYDGSTHYATIKVTSSEWNGATIVSGTTTDYGESVTTAGVYNTSYNLKPGYKDFTNGAKTIQYKVTGGDYYNDKTGSATVTVTKKALTATQITAYTPTWASGTTYTRSGVATGVGSETVTVVYTPYTNVAGTTYSYATSAASGKFTIALNPANSNYTISGAGNLTPQNASMTGGSVAISGTAQYASTLTATITDTSPAADSYTCTWYSNSSNSNSGGTQIATGTASNKTCTYTVGTGLVGKYIYVTVTATKANYSNRSFSSSATAAVTARTVTVTAPTVVSGTKTYNGSAQNLLSAAGSCSTGGTMYWYSSNPTTSSSAPSFSTSTWTTTNPGTGTYKGTNAATYYVWYYCKVDDTTNNTGSNLNTVKSVNKAIGAATPTVTLNAKTEAQRTFTGSAIAANTATVTLVNSETFSGTITYTYYTNSSCSSGATTTAPTSGTWYAKATTAAFTNYNAGASSCVNHTIVTATPTVTLNAKTNMVYNGSAQSANTATVSPNGGGAVTYTYYTDSSCSTQTGTAVASGGASAAGGAPKSAGNWYVKASVAAVSGKTAAASSSCVAHTIEAATPTVTLNAKTEAQRTFTGSAIAANTATVTLVNSETFSGTITYTYYTNSSCSSGVTTTAPTSGTWYAKATTAAFTNYNAGASSCVNHTIVTATPTVTLNAKTNMVYNGSSQAANTATVSPNGGGAVTYTYYTNNACSAGATTTAPTNAGSYWVKASVAAVSGKTAAASSSCVAHTISAKALTATQITAYTPTWASGTTYTRSGVATGVGSETVTVVYTPYSNSVGTYSYASTATSDKFTIALNPANSNYTISGADNLTITGAAITGTVTISGTATWGETLTANPSCTTPSSGCSFSNYQWKANGTAISGATSSTYTITEDQIGKTITVSVVASATNYADKTLTSSATSAVAKRTPTVTLTASNSNYRSGSAISGNAATATDGGTSITLSYTYVYYTNSSCSTQTTTSGSGASAAGGAPVNVGQYYYKATSVATDSYTSASSGCLSLRINRRKITLSVATNGGTITGVSGTTVAYYAGKGETSLYTGVRSGSAVTAPAANKNGYTFKGWYSAASGGSQVLKPNGSFSGSTVSNIVTATAWNPNANKTLHAQYTANELSFSNETLNSGTYGTAYTSNAFSAASNGTGSYTYTIASGAPTGATIDSTNRTISFTNTTVAGTYNVVVTATDDNSSATKNATMTIVINRQNISFPTCTSKAYSGGEQTLFEAHSSGPYTNSAIKGTNVNSYSGNLTPTANYQWDSGSNVTSARSLTCQITKTNTTTTLSAVTKTYNGTNQALTNEASAKLSSNNSTISGASFTYAYYSGTGCSSGNALSDAPKDAGTYSVKATVTGTSNYNTSTSSCVTYTMNARALTATQITAYTPTWASGGTYTRSGVSTGVGSETVTLVYTPYTNVAGTAYTYATSAGSGKFTLAINPANNNYSISSAGNLTPQSATMSGGSVAVTESAIYGSTLTATITDTSPAADSYTCTWYSNTTNSNSGGTQIATGTASNKTCTYTVGTGLVGKYIYVTITASKANYTNKTFSSSATAAVTARTVTVTAPTVVSGTKTYNGSDQALLSAAGSCTTGGTMYWYSSNPTTNSTAPSWNSGTGWTTTSPGTSTYKGKNAGTYYIWYYCKVDDTTNNTGSNLNTVKSVNKAISKKALTSTQITAYTPTWASGGTYTRSVSTGVGSETVTLVYTPYTNVAGTAYTYATSAGSGKFTLAINPANNNYSISSAGNLTPQSATMSGGSVAISGTAQYASTLTATITDTSPAADSYTCTWYSNTTNSNSGGTQIATGTASNKTCTYTVGTGLVGKYIYVTITASKANYTNKTFSSSATAAVTARTVTVTAPTVVSGTKTYNGSDQALLSAAGSCTTGGTMYWYSSNPTTSSTAPSWNSGTGWTTTSPGTSTYKGKNAGTYYIWYYCKVDDTTNNTGSNLNTVKSVNKAISKKALTATQITAYSTAWVNGGTYTRSVSTGVGSETVSLTYTPYINTAGSYTYATSAGSGNFTLSQTNTNYSISGAGNLTITVSNAIASDYIISSSQGTSWSSGASGVYQTNDHEYRYVGAEPNNYVKFNDDMYQIIGVFDENSHGITGKYLVKLIAVNPLGGYSWGVTNSAPAYTMYSTYKNNWEIANANILLNEYFLNATDTSSTYGSCYNWTYHSRNSFYKSDECSNIIGYGIQTTTLRNYIQPVTWYLKGYDSNSYSKQDFYTCERSDATTITNCTSGNSGAYATKVTNRSIGLMYASDYLYASSYYSSTDTTTGGAMYYGQQNWLHKGVEWTITPIGENDSSVAFISYGGVSGVTSSASYWERNLRPTFYLKSTIKIKSGDGSFNNPFIIG